MNYCVYYQARVSKKETWFLVATLKSCEHLAFDRTLDKENAIFEFFVPEDLEQKFVSVLKKLKEINIVYEFQKMNNRLAVPGSEV